MKKIMIVIALVFAGLLVFSACDTQHKCAAYGHYTEVVNVDDNSNQL